MMLLSVSCLWAVDKPTERTKDCVTSECHNTYTRDRHVHKPIELGVCKYCHKLDDPREHTFELFRTGKELCGSCHEEKTLDLSSIPSLAELKPVQIGEGTYLHEPLEEGQCIDCHNPHSGPNEFLLSASTVAESCLECHDDMNFNVKNSHEPVDERKCTECHDSHSSTTGICWWMPKNRCAFHAMKIPGWNWTVLNTFIAP
ncbi:MAG: cytochrome c3 family protein [Acidobacteriota bacterium]